MLHLKKLVFPPYSKSYQSLRNFNVTFPFLKLVILFFLNYNNVSLINYWKWNKMLQQSTSSAPPKHRLLDHQQPKHQLLKHRLATTSTVKNIDWPKHQLSISSKNQNWSSILFHFILYYLGLINIGSPSLCQLKFN